MIKFLILASIAIIIQSLQIETDICRITYDQNGELANIISCEEIDQCISGQSGSGSQCGQYSYKPLSLKGDCASTCCPQMDVKILQTVEEIQICQTQFVLRQVLRIGLIVAGIVLIVGILMGIGLTCIFGYHTNPYTGQRKYVGCCCCRKSPNFQSQPQNFKDRRQENIMQAQPKTENRF